MSHQALNMSWHNENYYENSVGNPRKQPPPGPSGHTVATVRPLIPEDLSVFPQPSRQPLANVNSSDRLSRTIPVNKAPQPQQLPIREDFRSPSELSRR